MTPTHFTKIISLISILVLSISVYAQKTTRPIEREWTSFVQIIPVKTDKKVDFKLQADVKVVAQDDKGNAGLWVRVDNTNGESGFFDNMNDRPITSSEWKTYTIEGSMDQNASTVNFGGICVLNGDFYFDNVKFFTKNEQGVYEPLEIKNPGFEEQVINQDEVPNWLRGTSKNRTIRIKGFTYQSTKDKTEGKYGLLITGKNVKKDSTRYINASREYTPQIGTLVSMLNNLSKRVERVVQNLDQRELDHLMDEKANRIGALLMHLAATEVYYQAYTFENRGFNEEEKKKWGVALSLGEDARAQIKGHDVDYYLNLYKEVRKKTLEELKKRNDDWLTQGASDAAYSNYHYNWFHVMEHQSSHLGQILLLKKRIPKENTIKLPEDKVDQ